MKDTSMTKEEKLQVRAKGMIIIRAQYNHRKEKWQIARNTEKGGWEVISFLLYTSRELAESMIDCYIKNEPEKYCKG